MRYIALFLSIIVITLTITPCCAFEGLESAVKATIQHEDQSSDSQSDDCCKDCSPFYVCGTCIGFVFSQQHEINFDFSLMGIDHNTAYLPIELPLIPFAIWQPPKIS